MAKEPNHVAHASLYGFGLEREIRILPQTIARYRKVARQIARPGLTHCTECDLWLKPEEGCLHIPPRMQ